MKVTRTLVTKYIRSMTGMNSFIFRSSVLSLMTCTSQFRVRESGRWRSYSQYKQCPRCIFIPFLLPCTHRIICAINAMILEVKSRSLITYLGRSLLFIPPLFSRKPALLCFCLSPSSHLFLHSFYQLRHHALHILMVTCCVSNNPL